MSNNGGGETERILCMNCGKSVSTAVPKGTIVRAWVECPECIEAKRRPSLARRDEALCGWLFGIVGNKPTRPGDFLKSLVDAALLADLENYPLLRPALLELKEKYPKYYDEEAKPEC